MTKQGLSNQALSVYYPPQSGDLLEEFERTHPTYKLFREKGLDKDRVEKDVNGNDVSTVNKILDDGLFRRLRRGFLVQIDLSKGPIERKVIKLERRRDLNPDTKKMQEYLVTHVEWIGKDFLGNEIVSTEVLEGMCNKPITQTTLVKGRRVTALNPWGANTLEWTTPLRPGHGNWPGEIPEVHRGAYDYGKDGREFIPQTEPIGKGEGHH